MFHYFVLSFIRLSRNAESNEEKKGFLFSAVFGEEGRRGVPPLLRNSHVTALICFASFQHDTRCHMQAHHMQESRRV